MYNNIYIMWHLRQSKHLQKKVKEKRDKSRRRRKTPSLSQEQKSMSGWFRKVHTQDPNTYQINMHLCSDEVRDYMCTAGTLWFSTCALIIWTLVMIFF